jgi:hypothetical protein
MENTDRFLLSVCIRVNPCPIPCRFEAVVEFGLKMSGQAGSLVVASVGAEAHYRVKLTWRREEKKEGKSSTGGGLCHPLPLTSVRGQGRELLSTD